jgi:hypothetical protein
VGTFRSACQDRSCEFTIIGRCHDVTSPSVADRFIHHAIRSGGTTSIYAAFNVKRCRARMTVITDHCLPVGVATLRSFRMRAISWDLWNICSAHSLV